MRIPFSMLSGAVTDVFRELTSRDSLIRQAMERIRELAQSFSTWDSLRAQYFSLGGFLLGLVFLLLLFCANTRKEARPLRGTMGVLLAVAMVNSCGQLWELVTRANPGAALYPPQLALFFQTENLICGGVLTLVLHTTYRGSKWAGATFALVTRLALVLLNWRELDSLSRIWQEGSLIWTILGQGIVLYFLGAIISGRTYFTTGWLWYTGYHLLPVALTWVVRLVRALISGLGLGAALEAVHRQMAPELPSPGPTLVIFALVLVTGILFDTSILAAGRRSAVEKARNKTGA